MLKEGYHLKVSESGITVYTSHEAGVVWALNTAAALLENDQISCCEIEDTPKYPHRGLEVIPEIDLPGHTRAVLTAFLQHGCFEKKVKLAVGEGISHRRATIQSFSSAHVHANIA